MIGGPDEAVAVRTHLTLARAGRRLAPARPAVEAGPTPAEHGYLHCGPKRPGPLREDGPQRDRVRRDGRLRRGASSILRNANIASTPSRKPTPSWLRWTIRRCWVRIDIPEDQPTLGGGVDQSLWLLDLTAQALRESRPLRLQGRVSTRRGALDVDRGNRRGRYPGFRAEHGLLSLRPTQPRRLRRQGALGDAQASHSHAEKAFMDSGPRGPGDGHRRRAEARGLAAERLADAIAAEQQQGRSVRLYAGRRHHAARPMTNSPLRHERLGSAVELWLGDRAPGAAGRPREQLPLWRDPARERALRPRRSDRRLRRRPQAPTRARSRRRVAGQAVPELDRYLAWARTATSPRSSHSPALDAGRVCVCGA